MKLRLNINLLRKFCLAGLVCTTLWSCGNKSALFLEPVVSNVQEDSVQSSETSNKTENETIRKEIMPKDKKVKTPSPLGDTQP